MKCKDLIVLKKLFFKSFLDMLFSFSLLSVNFISGRKPIRKLKSHSGPVLCLTADERFIVSGSEDKTLSVYDKRASEVYKTLKVSLADNISYIIYQQNRMNGKLNVI